MRAVAFAVRSAIARRWIQTAVIGVVVLLSTATMVVGLGLFLESRAPFDHTFARLNGAHAVVTFDGAKTTQDQVRATGGWPGVAVAAGPFASLTVPLTTVGTHSFPLHPAHVVGRDSATSAVDALSLDSGRWAQAPDEIVLSRHYARPQFGAGVGDHLTVATSSGTVDLLVVGIAYSVTDSAQAWVTSAEATALTPAGTPFQMQMLYRFQAAATDDQVRADVATASAGLPQGAVLGTASYLQARLNAIQTTAPYVPFLIAFSVLGIVMAVLIVANVVSGAVVAGFATIGMMKTLGFTPRQVSAVYVGQVLLPALVAAVVGAVTGHLVALPLLRSAARVYDVPTVVGVPLWLDLAAVGGLLGTVGIAAVLPAWRAALIPAIQAISTGRAPRTGRGYRVARLLARTALPSPVSLGLASPFARPARTVMTVIAILLGATTVTFALGMSTSLDKVAQGLSRTQADPITISFPVHVGKPGSPSPPPDADAGRRVATTQAALAADPDTAHVVAETEADVTVTGLSDQVRLTAYHGDASWTGFPLITGRWFTETGEVVVPTHLLHATGKTVGDTLTLEMNGRRTTVRIVGEILDQRHGGLDLATSSSTLSQIDPNPEISGIEVQVKPGTDLHAYVERLPVERRYEDVHVNIGDDPIFPILKSLLVTITLILAAVAALGVFNTVLLNTRERARDIGILKAIGMTPRQTRTMVVASMAGLGLIGGLIAIPTGVVLHDHVLPIMAEGVDTGLPADFIAVYQSPQLAALAVVGVLIAVLGALVPAGWAARTRVAHVLHSE